MSEDPGVSRSGRVRKKSSKLSDYPSPEAGEHRAVKRPAKSSPLHIHTTLTHNKTSQLGEQPPDLLLEDEEATSSVPSIKVDRFGLASGDGLQ